MSDAMARNGEFERQSGRNRAGRRALLAALVALGLSSGVVLPRAASAGGGDFGELGLGTQFVVVDGDGGSTAGVGVDVRARFLWVLGVDWSATRLEENEAVWGATPFRLGLMFHVLSLEHFGMHLSPGLSGSTFADAFNPVGASTWYRLGGGLEGRYEGFALGLDVHWSIPGEGTTTRYLEENGEALALEYAASGDFADQMAALEAGDLSSISVGDALDVLPLERLEFTIGLRYYF